MIDAIVPHGSGAESVVNGNTATLGGPAEVRLNVSRDDIQSLTKSGNDLIVQLVDGQQLVIENFYVPGPEGQVSQLFVGGVEVATGAGAAAGLSSSLLGAAGAGLVAAGVAAAGGDDAPTAAELALAKINAYDGTADTDEPTVDDYTAAGVEGVTADNIDAVNAAVAASADNDLTEAEVQALVDPIVALEKIEAYAEDNTNPAPTVDDYATAGVTGVTADNLADVNAAVDAVAGVDADTVAEVQALVDPILTAAALAKIEAYAEDNTNPAPTVDDYAAAGVTGVTADNLADVNAAVDAVAGVDADTVAEVQALVEGVLAEEAALDLINAYDGTAATDAPSEDDYTAAGIEGVTADNIDAVNAAVAAATDDDLTAEEIQAIADVAIAVDQIVDAATDGDDGTDAPVETFEAAGVTGVSDDNIDAINDYIAGLPAGSIDSVDELQGIVDQINAAIAETMAEALAEINMWDGSEVGDLDAASALLSAAGIEGTIVSDALLLEEGLDGPALEAIIAAVAATEEDLTLDELQALIDQTVAELLIESMPLSTADNTAEALAAVGVTGVSDLNQDEVQTAIAAAVDANPNMADSVDELQAIVDTVLAGLTDNALEKINDYAESDGATDAPTLDDYLAAGIVTPEIFEAYPEVLDSVISQLNIDVAATDGGLTTDDLQAMIDQIASNLSITENPDGSTTIVVNLDTDGDGVTDAIDTYVYDESGNNTIQYHDWDADGTVELQQDFTYDADGNVATQFDTSDLNDDGVPDSFLDSTFDPSGNLIEQNADEDGDGIWNAFRTYTYDENGNLETILALSDTDDNGLVDRQFFSEYDVSGNRISVDVRWDDNEDGTIDRSRMDTFNVDGFRIERKTDADGDGNYNSIISYERDENNVILSQINTFDDDDDGVADRIIHLLNDENGNHVVTFVDGNADGDAETISFNNSADASFDLTSAVAADAEGLEVITLGTTASSELTLSDEALGVLAAGDGAYQLSIDGDANDTVNVDAGITDTGVDTTIGGVTYDVYAGTTGEVLIDQDVTVSTLP